MNDKDLAEYQQLRAKHGLPKISNQEALVEASALINLISTVYGK